MEACSCFIYSVIEPPISDQATQWLGVFFNFEQKQMRYNQFSSENARFLIWFARWSQLVPSTAYQNVPRLDICHKKSSSCGIFVAKTFLFSIRRQIRDLYDPIIAQCLFMKMPWAHWKICFLWQRLFSSFYRWEKHK